MSLLEKLHLKKKKEIGVFPLEAEDGVKTLEYCGFFKWVQRRDPEVVEQMKHAIKVRASMIYLGYNGSIYIKDVYPKNSKALKLRGT